MISDSKLKVLIYSIMTVAVVCLGARQLAAQPAIFSFEEDLQSWTSSHVTLSQTSVGATDGNSALLIDDLTAGFKNNIATTPNFGPTTAGLTEAFNAFALAASVISNGSTPKLEFDLSWDFSAATSGYIQLGLFVNSSSAGGGGFKGYGTGAFINGNAGFAAWPTLGDPALADGATLTMTGPASAHVAVPFGPDKRLTLSNESTFFDIGFQSNGGWEGTVDFAIDNIKFSGVPVFEEHTLFSWETPDDAGTPGVNEQLEGWGSAQTPATQSLSITSTGATHGDFALQLDRTLQPAGFTWGSVFQLDASALPADQARIDDLVSRINGATQIAIDITYEDQFPISPSYTHLSLAFADESGAYYQASSSSFDIVEASNGPVTQTLIFEVAAFDDYNSDKNLAADGLLVGTSQLEIVLGTGTDDGAVYQIDNFRLISEVVESLPGDFDEDGDVDGRDFLVWQRGNSPNPLSANDLAEWQAAYNAAAFSAVVATMPEPAGLYLMLAGALVLIGRSARS